MTITAHAAPIGERAFAIINLSGHSQTFVTMQRAKRILGKSDRSTGRARFRWLSCLIEQNPPMTFGKAERDFLKTMVGALLCKDTEPHICRPLKGRQTT